MTIVIQDHVPPSLNKLVRMHWTQRRKWNHEWQQLVWAEIVRINYLKPIVKMRCRITLHHPRLYDKDNAYGACKPVVDALKNLHLIYDDSPQYLDLIVEQIQCPGKNKATEIELEAA